MAVDDTFSGPVDLTNCDREPIHIPGRVQSFGCLLAVSTDWIINHASENVEAMFGAPAAALIGQPISGLLSPDAIRDIRSRMQLMAGADAVERIFGLTPLADDDRQFDVALHVSGRSLVMEFEAADTARRLDYASYVRPMIDRIRTPGSVEELCWAAAAQVKLLTGFDRVMVYRFHPDDSGEVIAEAKRPDLEPYLGLHYPASDIPAQARALYTRNMLRIISDVNAEGVPVVPAVNPRGEPLDLSLSTLRAVSPIHLEYLRNMGVGASMSISIVSRGALWGLFACHHMAPRVLSYDVRTAAELFGQMFGFVLDQTEADIAQRQSERVRRLHDQLMIQLADGETLKDNIETISRAVSAIIPCDGVISWVDGALERSGRTPTDDEFSGLVRFLNTNAASEIYATDRLSEVYPPAADFVDRTAGLLALPVSRRPRDYIVLLRREVATTVTWAGDPDKPVTAGPNGVRLNPRKSFEAWREDVRGRSAPWPSHELEAANALRVTLLEVVLRLSEEANQERARAQERQELLIAELNHRVRNILNLIRAARQPEAAQ